MAEAARYYIWYDRNSVDHVPEPRKYYAVWAKMRHISGAYTPFDRFRGLSIPSNTPKSGEISRSFRQCDLCLFFGGRRRLSDNLRCGSQIPSARIGSL